MPYHAAGTTQRHFRTHIDKDGGILRWERMGRASKWIGGRKFAISFIYKRFGTSLDARRTASTWFDHPEPAHESMSFKADSEPQCVGVDEKRANGERTSKRLRLTFLH